MAENKGRLTYHQPAFVVMTTRGSFAMVRVTGLEPARFCHKNLNLACLPIPPHPHAKAIIP